MTRDEVAGPDLPASGETQVEVPAKPATGEGEAVNVLVEQDSYATQVEQDAPGPASLSPSELRIDFGAHLEANYQRLVAQMYAITLSPDQAHGAVQDAYSRAWRNWAVIGRSSDPTAWVRRVAVRTSMRNWRHVLARFGLVRPTPAVAEGLDARTTALLTALHQLPAPERRSIVLYHMAGLSQGEIAAVERVSAATIHSRLARARQVVAADTSDMLTGVIELPGGLLDADRGYVNEMTLASEVPTDQAGGEPSVGDGAAADIDLSWSAYGRWGTPDDSDVDMSGEVGGESPLDAGVAGLPADGGDELTIDVAQAAVADGGDVSQREDYDMSWGDGGDVSQREGDEASLSDGGDVSQSESAGDDVSQSDAGEAAPGWGDEVSQNEGVTPRDDAMPRDDSEEKQ